MKRQVAHREGLWEVELPRTSDARRNQAVRDPEDREAARQMDLDDGHVREAR